MNPFEIEMPNDQEAEKSALGSVLLDANMFEDVESIIGGASAFWDERHRTIWNALAAMRAEGVTEFDGVRIRDHMERDGTFEKIGDFATLGTLISSVPSSFRAVEYARIVHEHHQRRLLISAFTKVANESYDLKRSISEIADQGRKCIDSILEIGMTKEPEPFGQYLDEHLRSLEGDRMAGLQTKFGSWNRIIGGLQNEMTVIAARPSMGKTALGLNLFVDVALHCNVPSVFFSLEMQRDALMNRIISIIADVPHEHLRRHKLDDVDRENISLCRERLENSNMRIDDSKIGIHEICNRAKLMKRRHGVGAVYVDYLQLIRTEQSRNMTRETVVADLSHRLKDLSGILDCPVVVMAQLNRDPAKADAQPELHHLRESDAIAHDADTVILLWADPMDQPPPEQVSPNVEVIYEPTIVNVKSIVAKQRNGHRGIMPMVFDKDLQQFRDGRYS